MAADGNKRLEGRVAIVTGAASGFGLAITNLFASHGATVIAADLNESALRKHFGSSSNIVTVVANVTKATDWRTVCDIAIFKFKALDIVVNNAGTSYKNKATVEVTEEEFDKVMNVNIKSVFLSVQICVPEMIKAGRGGSMINISSIGASRPRPGLVWYNASKGAVSNATKGLAAEYGPHQIRVNSICPLLTSTGLFEMFAGVPDTPENRQKFIGNVPMGRLGETEDVANAALFLASDDSKFVTGINMEVDGGRGV